MTPIEQKFWDALSPIVAGLYRHPVAGMSIDRLHQQFEIDYAAPIIAAPQVTWNRFRTDFTILARRSHRDGGGMFRMIVECDGHEFHSRTKEQAQRDRSRDRYFLAQGVIVMRFTGSELWNNATGCVCEVISCLHHHNALFAPDFGCPSFVSNTICELMEDASVSGTPEHLAMVVGAVADADGVTRASLAVLSQETGITQDDLPELSERLKPYLSMRTVDTYGRIVFRFHRRPLYPIGQAVRS